MSQRKVLKSEKISDIRSRIDCREPENQLTPPPAFHEAKQPAINLNLRRKRAPPSATPSLPHSDLKQREAARRRERNGAARSSPGRALFQEGEEVVRWGVGCFFWLSAAVISGQCI